ncbi:MAG: RNA polymerase sigma factor [Crocinitomicaceae bacterium]
MNYDEFIPKIKEGNKLAFKELYEATAPLFKGIAYRYLHDEAKAEDVLQETYIKIYKSIASYTGEGNFEGWMKRILVNNCLNYIKKEKKFAFDSLNGTPDQPDRPWDSVIEHLSFEEIVGLIENLPTGYKAVFNMAVFEGYSHKEIGEALGITASASRSQLTKAKASLKEELKKINIYSSIA